MNKHILIVDDDPRNVRLVSALLRVSGYETIEAANGQEAVDKAREHHPDLILMDIQMPVMDGLEATRQLKSDQKTKDIPVIALTSFAMSGDRERILAGGCDDCLTKPLDTRNFVKRITAFFEEQHP
jgi:two-component system, cell cycle response regulator DivK